MLFYLAQLVHPKYDNDPAAKVRPEQGLLKLRKSLQLYANIRPVSTYISLHHLSPLKSKIIEGVGLCHLSRIDRRYLFW
jgi:3-isopropylmalate dehydrogenase